MANHKSALKRAKQNELRNLRNRKRKTRMKNVIKEAETAAASGSPEEALAKLKTAISVIDKTASSGVIHPNKASRTVSRLNRRVKLAVEQSQSA